MRQYERNYRELKDNAGRPANVIGITGGVGSGKTVATTALKAAGYTVIDADEISRTLFARGTDGEKTLLRTFPQATAADGMTLDRAALRHFIATDTKAKRTLDAITHPAIIAEISALIGSLAPPVILSAPLLSETPLASMCDFTVCVYAPRAVRSARICARDGVSPAQAQALIDAQIPDAERCSMCDYIVPSDVPIEEFTAEILWLFGVITGKIPLDC